MSNEELKEQHSNDFSIYVVFPNGIKKYNLGCFPYHKLQISFDSMVRVGDHRGYENFWVEKWRIYPTKETAQEKFDELYGGENYVEYDPPMKLDTPEWMQKNLKP
jgi:hypothetical protein